MSENLSVTATEARQCTCGHHDEEVPELDVRLIPHAIRHAAVFGALSSIAAGQAMVLVAPHDPQPLLRQIAERFDDVSVTYLVRGPEEWQLLLGR